MAMPHSVFDSMKIVKEKLAEVEFLMLESKETSVPEVIEKCEIMKEETMHIIELMNRFIIPT